MEVKKPITYDQQIVELQSKGFIVTDPDICIQRLEQIRYYRLLAYLLPFKNPTTKKYRPDIPIERVFKIYEFDGKIRALISKTIDEIEIYMRSILSYYYAHRYGALGYLLDNNFNSFHDHTRFLKLISDCINNNKSNLIIKWHKTKYGGKFPIWVIIEFFTFGMLSKFYSDMKRTDQIKLANSIGVDKSQLSSWLYCLTGLRNSCAHYSRLYFTKFPAVPAMPEKFFYQTIPPSKIFDQLIPLRMTYPDRKKWNSNFIIELESIVEKYSSHIELDHIGFPENWKSILTFD